MSGAIPPFSHICFHGVHRNDVTLHITYSQALREIHLITFAFRKLTLTVIKSLNIKPTTVTVTIPLFLPPPPPPNNFQTQRTTRLYVTTAGIGDSRNHAAADGALICDVVGKWPDRIVAVAVAALRHRLKTGHDSLRRSESSSISLPI